MFEEVFKEWKSRPLHKDEHFIRDGVIDGSRWESGNRLKVLFLLKEAYCDPNDEEGGYDDLCWLIREKWKGPKYNMWWKAGQWAYGLQSLAEGKRRPFPQDRQALTDSLLSCAVVNIKKSSGHWRSSAVQLASYVDQDWDLIHQQIHGCEPDIIVGGNTWQILQSSQRTDLGKSKRVGKSDWIYSAGSLPCYLLDAYHPAWCGKPAEVLYEEICDQIGRSEIFRQ
jgi:hypothetical protein